MAFGVLGLAAEANALPPTTSALPGLIARGDAALARGDSISAIGYYRDAVNRGPREAGGYAALGRAYLSLREPEHAREAFLAGLHNTRGSDELSLGLAQTYELLDDPAHALLTLRELVAAGGHSRPVLERLAQLAEANGALTEALAARRALLSSALLSSTADEPALRGEALRQAQIRVSALLLLLGPTDRLSAAHCTERAASAFLRQVSGCSP
jgi:tetratricopeptide (TPR) repeat protein